MAVTHVGTATVQNGTAGTALSVPFPETAQADDFLLAVFINAVGSGPTLTDGNAWSTSENPSIAGGFTGWLAGTRTLFATGGETALTGTWPSSTTYFAAVMQFRNDVAWITAGHDSDVDTTVDGGTLTTTTHTLATDVSADGIGAGTYTNALGIIIAGGTITGGGGANVVSDMAFSPDQWTVAFEDLVFDVTDDTRDLVIHLGYQLNATAEPADQVVYTHTSGGGLTSAAIARMMVPFTPNPANVDPSAYSQYERRRARAKALPFYLDTGLLKGMD